MSFAIEREEPQLADVDNQPFRPHLCRVSVGYDRTPRPQADTEGFSVARALPRSHRENPASTGTVTSERQQRGSLGDNEMTKGEKQKYAVVDGWCIEVGGPTADVYCPYGQPVEHLNQYDY